MACPAPFVLDPSTSECVFSVSMGIVDEFGHPLDGDADPKGKHGCQHTDTPEWKAAHRPRKKAVTEKTMDEQLQPEAPADAAPAAPATVASVGSDDSQLFNLGVLMPKDGQVSSLTVVLAGLAIAGGVALKLVPPWLKSRGEMAAKRMELKAKRLELEQKSKDDKKEGDCNTRHLACEMRVSALTDRIKLAEKAIDSLSGDVASSKDNLTKLSLKGGDDDRLSKVEEQVAALTKKVGA